MNAIMKTAGLLLVVGLALWFTHPWNLWGSPGVAESIEDARALVAEAKRVDPPAGQQQQSLVPQPGDAWRQTALFQGRFLERDFFNADRVTTGEMRFITEAEAHTGTDPNHIVLEHRAIDVTGRDDLSQIHPELREKMREDARLREAVLARSSYTQVLDALGRQVEIEPNLDFGQNHSELVMDPFLLVLLSTPSGFPDEPLDVGTTWSWEVPLVFHPDLKFTIQSTVDHFEEIDGEPVVVIHSQTECQTAERMLYIEMPISDGRETLRAFRERLAVAWNQDSRHSLRDGRRLLSTGQFYLDTLFTVIVQPNDPALARPVPGQEHLGMTFNFDFVTETEPL